MRELFDILFYDFRQYALLIIFSLISMGLLVNQDAEALRSIRAASLEIFGAIETPPKIWNQYFGLANENMDLLATNARLSAEANRMRVAQVENEKLRQLLKCKQETPRPLQFAFVVDRTFHPERNLFMIDVGESDGIEFGMAVITDKGLVGRVILSSWHFSIVQPVINTDFKVSVVSEQSRLYGIVHWTGGDIAAAQLLYIPKGKPLQIGEQVLTTEFSSFANARVALGNVESVEIRDGEFFQFVKIRLAVDFGSLEHVFVDLQKPNAEQDHLRSRYKKFQ
jgi:rod shape-determining protein MreC